MTTDLINGILQDKSASYWLKNALQEALSRDVVDAFNDAEILYQALNERLLIITADKPS